MSLNVDGPRVNSKKSESEPGLKDKKVVDLLTTDRPISGQNYVCMSFVSPEEIIKNREHFVFSKFVENYQFSKIYDLMTKYTNYLSFKYDIDPEELHQEMAGFMKTEKATLHESVTEDYELFVDRSGERYNKEFDKANHFQTSTRGVKVRGVFDSIEEAEIRCRMLREDDPYHDIFVGQIGVWMPFHPDAYKTGRVEYLEKELNELVHEKMKNDEQAKNEFDNRVKTAKFEAISDNMKKAKESNNRLTQTINEKGDLVSVDNMNTQEKHLGVNATDDEIKKALFEGDDVVMSQDNDRGLSQLTSTEERGPVDALSDMDKAEEVSRTV